MATEMHQNREHSQSFAGRPACGKKSCRLIPGAAIIVWRISKRDTETRTSTGKAAQLRQTFTACKSSTIPTPTATARRAPNSCSATANCACSSTAAPDRSPAITIRATDHGRLWLFGMRKGLQSEERLSVSYITLLCPDPVLTINLTDITSATIRETLIDHTSVRNVAKVLYITKISLGICHATQDKDHFSAPFQTVTRPIHERITSIAICATIMPLIPMHQ